MGKLKSSGGETSLAALLTYTGKNKNRVWDLKKARACVRLLAAGKSIEATAKYLKLKNTSVLNMLAELKRAARAGYSLERYFKEGRPLQVGRKVLAS